MRLIVFLLILTILPILSWGQSAIHDTIQDNEGNKYRTVQIGEQVWMADNLRATKYANGDPIEKMSIDSARFFATYAWPKDDSITYASTFGALYNFYVVEDNRGICPQGWHVPRQKEFHILKDFIGGEDTGGGKLKEKGTMHWLAPNTGATDEFNFHALPAGTNGWRWPDIGKNAWWWGSRSRNNINADGFYTTYDDDYFTAFNGLKPGNHSIRCIQGSLMKSYGSIGIHGRNVGVPCSSELVTSAMEFIGDTLPIGSDLGGNPLTDIYYVDQERSGYRSNEETDTIRVILREFQAADSDGNIYYAFDTIYSLGLSTIDTFLCPGDVVGNSIISTPGIYQDTLYPGCYQTYNVHLPQIEIVTDNSDLCDSDSILLQAPPGFKAFHWSTGELDQNISVDQPGTYSLEAEDSSGCIQLSDTIEIMGPASTQNLLVCAVSHDTSGQQLVYFQDSAEYPLSYYILSEVSNTSDLRTVDSIISDGTFVFTTKSDPDNLNSFQVGIIDNCGDTQIVTDRTVSSIYLNSTVDNTGILLEWNHINYAPISQYKLLINEDEKELIVLDLNSNQDTYHFDTDRSSDLRFQVIAIMDQPIECGHVLISDLKSNYSYQKRFANAETISSANEHNVGPNPTRGTVNISGRMKEFDRIDVIDPYGKVIRTIQPNGYTLQLHDLHPGIYFLRFRNNSTQIVERMIKL